MSTRSRTIRVLALGALVGLGVGVGCAGPPHEDRRVTPARPTAHSALEEVHGRVVDAEGHPVANALVRLGVRFADPGEVFEVTRTLGAARSGPDGRFAVTPEPFSRDGCLQVHALDRTRGRPRSFGQADIGSLSSAGRTIAVGDLPVEAERNFHADLRVVVLAGGQPLQGARVRLTFGYIGESLSTVGFALLETTSRGEAVVSLGGRNVQVRVEAEGFAADHREVDRVETEDVTVEVNLKPASLVRGRVLDPNGEPLGRARIETREDDGPWRGHPAHSTIALADAEGRYVLGALAPGRKFAVSVTAPDQGSYCPGDLSLAALARRIETPRTEDLDFRFVRSGRLSCELWADRGAGEAPTDILHSYVERRDETTGAWVPHETGEQLVGGFGLKQIHARLVPGRYRVLCTGNSVQPTYTEEATVSAGDKPVHVVAHGRRGRRVSGCVVDSTGASVNGARVGFGIGPWIFGVPPGPWYSPGTSTYEGDFTLWDLPFTETHVYVAKRGHEELELAVPAGREDVELGRLVLRAR